MPERHSRRRFLSDMNAAFLAALFAGKISADQSAGQSTPQAGFDYRRIRWGMSQEEVLAAEDTAPQLHMPACIMYDQTVDQLPLSLFYLFAQQGDAAVCVAASLQTNLSSNSFYVDVKTNEPRKSRLEEAKRDYAKIKAVMADEFGQPGLEDVNYEDEELVQALLSSNRGDRRFQSPASSPELHRIEANLRKRDHDAATIRSLMFYSGWQTPSTNISLRLMPTSFGGVMLIARHDSNELQYLLDGTQNDSSN